MAIFLILKKNEKGIFRTSVLPLVRNARDQNAFEVEQMISSRLRNFLTRNVFFIGTTLRSSPLIYFNLKNFGQLEEMEQHNMKPSITPPLYEEAPDQNKSSFNKELHSVLSKIPDIAYVTFALLFFPPIAFPVLILYAQLLMQKRSK